MKKSKRAIERIKKVQDLLNNTNEAVSLCTHRMKDMPVAYTLTQSNNGTVTCGECGENFTLLDSTDTITIDNLNDAIQTILVTYIDISKEELSYLQKLKCDKDIKAISKLFAKAYVKFNYYEKILNTNSTSSYTMNHGYHLLPGHPCYKLG